MPLAPNLQRTHDYELRGRQASQLVARMKRSEIRGRRITLTAFPDCYACCGFYLMRTIRGVACMCPIRGIGYARPCCGIA